MIRILAYGDSNTFGTAPMSVLEDTTVHPRGARWADVLAAELGDGVEMVVEGLGGRTTVFDDPIEGAYRNGLAILPAVLHSHKPIDLLLVCLGTNDQKARFGLSGQDIALGMARLVRDARASGTVARVLVICPPPLEERGDLSVVFAGAGARAADLPVQMARFAATEGAAFFDAGQVISVDPVDGIHWDRAAHAALGVALAPVVRDLLG